jgi:hypothetical protein
MLGLERNFVGVRAFCVPRIVAMVGINLMCSEIFALRRLCLVATCTQLLKVSSQSVGL